MDLQYFPHFIRATFPDIHTLEEEEVCEMGREFKAYLRLLFEGQEDKLEELWCIDLWKVIAESNNPLRAKGYHPELVLHFINFVNENTNETTQ